jgi:hypothetical protein
MNPVPKPTFKKPPYPKVGKGQRERIWKRCEGICECGCGMGLWRTRYIIGNHAELHHIIPLGMGGSRRVYEDYELMYITLKCHDLEEAQGYPHRVSWVELMKKKMGIKEGTCV